jgi:hypothetical protein
MLNIEAIEQNLEKLLRIEAALNEKLARGDVTQEEYQQTLLRINQERKKWEAKLEDSVVDMFASDGAPPPAPEVALDPLAAAMQYRETAEDNFHTQDREPEIKITDVKRGLQDEKRALEIKFQFRDQDCKAIINSKEGRWHFSTHGQSLYLIQFINALRKSPRFAEVFEKEVNRHPDAWYKAILKGRIYNENNKQKDSRDNFPDVCRQILQRYSSHDSAAGLRKKSKKSRLPDLTGKPVVVLKVEHGEYTKEGKKDFGRGFLEFPRFLTIHLDWGKYRLRAEITTDQDAWNVIPREADHDYPKELLQEFNHVVPFMVQELERAGNKYLAHTMVTEMRLRDHRHQWESVVKNCPALHFPHACKELFEESQEPA